MSGSGTRQAAFVNIQKKYRSDPVAFSQDMTKFFPDENQIPVMMDIANHSRVSVRSGQGVGKTAMEANILLWYLTMHPNARVVATAPTRQQLHDVLWAEVEKWRANSPLLSSILKWTKTYVYVAGREKRWFAVARTATKPENMQGFHEEYMLFIIDEASGVSEPIMEAILGTLSGPENKLLMCGNPTQTSGTFYDSHTRDRDIYCAHKISSRDCPRTNKTMIEAMERKYGKDSNFIRVRVDGEFPLQDDDVFLPLSLLEQSIHADWEPTKAAKIDIAADIARYGDDKSVIAFKVNEKVEIYDKVNGRDLMSTADKIVQLGFELIKKHRYKGVIIVRIDDTGVGGGVTDRLLQLKKQSPSRFAWLEVLPVMFGQRIRHMYYHDTTTYMYACMKEMISCVDADGKPKPVELILPNDDDLIAQLSSRRYEMTEASKLKIESKDDYKKRVGSSPDEADCVIMLCLPAKIKRKRTREEN